MKKSFLLTSLFIVFAFVGAHAQTQTVYSSANGAKYHTADCKLSGDAKGMTLTAAKKAGKTPCGICKPDDHLKDKTTQCTGTTADGTRCKRLTASASGKCFQHQ